MQADCMSSESVCIDKPDLCEICLFGTPLSWLCPGLISYIKTGFPGVRVTLQLNRFATATTSLFLEKFLFQINELAGH